MQQQHIDDDHSDNVVANVAHHSHLLRREDKEDGWNIVVDYCHDVVAVVVGEDDEESVVVDDIVDDDKVLVVLLRLHHSNRLLVHCNLMSCKEVVEDDRQIAVPPREEEGGDC